MKKGQKAFYQLVKVNEISLIRKLDDSVASFLIVIVKSPQLPFTKSDDISTYTSLLVEPPFTVKSDTLTTVVVFDDVT